MTVPAAVRGLLDRIGDADRAVQGDAFQALCRMTETSVPWADAAWDDLVAALDHRNTRTRAIAGQLLARLAPGAASARVATALPRLVAATQDPQFVTGRHILQSLAHVARAAPPLPALLFGLLDQRFRACADDKNATLIRFDIQTVMRAIHDRTDDVAIRRRALDLVMLEPDERYRRKYLGCWR